MRFYCAILPRKYCYFAEIKPILLLTNASEPCFEETELFSSTHLMFHISPLHKQSLYFSLSHARPHLQPNQISVYGSYSQQSGVCSFADTVARPSLHRAWKTCDSPALIKPVIPVPALFINCEEHPHVAEVNFCWTSRHESLFINT